MGISELLGRAWGISEIGGAEVGLGASFGGNGDGLLLGIHI
jgi:hypothetical protein